VIGGGYDNDREALARRHGILHTTAAKVWKDLKMWEVMPGQSRLARTKFSAAQSSMATP
jgi:hypothetical protein